MQYYGNYRQYNEQILPYNLNMMPQKPNMLKIDPYTYPQNLSMALKLIKDAVSGENEDKMFYNYLIEKAPTQEDKDIITGIRDDEIKHSGLFRQIYLDLTGQRASQFSKGEFLEKIS